MSGIYIPGMAMPSNCFTCPVEREADCDVYKGFVVEKGKRYERCPLIPVPDHGRLIDADELLSKDRNIYRSDGTAIGARRYIEFSEIDYAPTIIPAEEGE